MKISALEFARRAGTSRATVLDYVAVGRIHGEKISNAWHFDEEELYRFMQMYPSKPATKRTKTDILIDGLFIFKNSKEAGLAYLSWDEAKFAVIPNSYQPLPANTVRNLAIGTLWELYSTDIVKRIQSKG